MVRKAIWRGLVAVQAVVSFLLPGAMAGALTEDQLYVFSQNDIFYYDPDGGCMSGAVTYAKNASSFGKLAAIQVAFVETYHEIAVMHSINYGIPWEAVVAQGILESASGTSNFAVNRNNFFGIGAFDSNPGAAQYFDTPEEGWEGYYKNIQRTRTYRAHGVFAGETVTDPYAYIVAVKAAGYATDPDYVAKVSSFIDAITELAAARGWQSSAELAAAHPEWLVNAEANRQGAETGAIAAGAASLYSFCNGGLVSGGMTLAEAEAFMQAYIDEANRFPRGNLHFEGALVQDSGCPGGTLNNCSAFTQWFLNRYTTLGPDGVGIRQGSQAVKRYLSEFSELTDGGKMPRPYAVMSMGPMTGSAEGWGNHTGIVLGIDEANNQIIIGEASCGMAGGGRSYAPGAHVYPLDKYTNSASQYGPTYAYTDSVLKGL